MTVPQAPAGNGDSLDARLADLHVVGGDALVRRLLGRFGDHLQEMLDGPDDVWTRRAAHRTGGLASMIGFDRLAAACMAVENAARIDGRLLDAARNEAAAACAEVHRRLRKIA